MRFDWQQFCDTRGVGYVEEGPNVARGNINVTCPFCPDPSEHLGLSLNTKHPSWGCWRCKTAGVRPEYLIRKLLGVTTAQAEGFVAEQQDGTADSFATLFDKPKVRARTVDGGARTLPSGVMQLGANKPSARPFLDYLEQERGFPKDGLALATTYGLHYALSGEQANRIVLPIYKNKVLWSYVGRAVGAASLRYKADEDGRLKKCLALWDELSAEQRGDQVLAVTEGPFDFLKVDFYGRPLGLRATCTFGTAYTSEQVALLARLAPRFKKVVVLFDPAARYEASRLSAELSELSGRYVRNTYDRDAEDPGAMTAAQVQRLARSVGL